MSFRWKLMLLVSLIIVLLMSGCGSENTPQSDSASNSPSATSATAESTLALDIGFSDEQVVLAGSESARLNAIHESTIDGKPYVAFYLQRDYEERVLNDFATIVLVYEGKADSVGNFVYRIEIRDPIDPKVVLSLPNSTGLSASLPFSSPVITAYEAAGFSLRATKDSTDAQNAMYHAVVVDLEHLYYALTFEKQRESIFLEAFALPELPPKDLETDWNGTWDDLLFAFDQIWTAEQSDILPKSKIEKALYAIGCNFSFSMDLGPGFVHNSIRDESLEYNGSRYSLYSCAFLSDVTIDDSIFKLVNNFALVSLNNDINEYILFNKHYKIPVMYNWGDINKDGIPDLTINKKTLVGASGTVIDEGQEVFQIASNGNMIDLLFGIPMPEQHVQRYGRGGGPGSDTGFQFEDIDGDGVTEFIERQIISTYYDPGVALSSHKSIMQIYRLEDDFYYLPSNEEYDFLCLEAIEELPSEIVHFELSEIMRCHSESCYEGEIPFGHLAFYYKDVFVVLRTCDAVGVRPENHNEFISKIKEKFPNSCSGFLYSINPRFFTGFENSKSQATPKYWQMIFDEFTNECATRGEKELKINKENGISVLYGGIKAIISKDVSAFKDLIPEDGVVFGVYPNAGQLHLPIYKDKTEIVREINGALENSEPTCISYYYNYQNEIDILTLYFEGINFKNKDSSLEKSTNDEVVAFRFYRRKDQRGWLWDFGEVTFPEENLTPPDALEDDYFYSCPSVR